MKTIVIDRFDRGMALDKYQQGTGLSSVIKDFNIFRSPNRLFPTRDLITDTDTQFKVGNVLVGSNGSIYGLGTVAASGNDTQDIFIKANPSSAWAQVHANKLRSGFTVDYTGFLEYKSYFYAFNQSRYLGKYDRAGVVAADATFFDLDTANFTNAAQPIIHPKDDVMYIPHDNYISTVNGVTKANKVLTLPSSLRIRALSWYGNYLAIACSPTTSGGLGNSALRSTVYLWDRDTSLTTVSESIDWGTGDLQVLNNFDGTLVGISHLGGSSTYITDYDSVQIKGYNGGAPFLIKEFTTIRETTTTPSCTINARVDYIFRGRLYFSIDITGGSTSPELHGLWAMSKSKITGEYAVNIEKVTTGACLAAAQVSDFLVVVDTTVGNTRRSDNTASLTSAFPTAVVETVVNPQMSEIDYIRPKQLMAVQVDYQLLLANQTVVLSYKVDDGSWATILTASTASTVSANSGKASSGEFTKGRNYEFRVQATGGAVVHAISYKYDTLMNLV